MARHRTVKPEFWTSEQVMECSRDARLLFIGLWNFCDDAGRHPFNPKQIKALVFPGDDLSLEQIASWLGELEQLGLIATYEVAHKQYLEITGWRHQKIDKPQPARFPSRPIGDNPNGSGTSLPDHSTNGSRTFAPEESRIEESREENISSSLRSEALEAEDVELYRKGKRILGSDAGGLIRKLVSAKGGSVPLARAALETASTKDDPREYIGGVVRTAATGPPGKPNLLEIARRVHEEKTSQRATG